jgi:hypothetical protein
MNKLSTFIIGMIAGALLFYIIQITINKTTKISDEEKLRQQLIETLSNKITDIGKEPETQYIDVKGKKGIVTIYTGMPKDSVKLLLGKPDEVSLNEIYNTHYEKWGYKISNNNFADLYVDFENGILAGVRQD